MKQPVYLVLAGIVVGLVLVAVRALRRRGWVRGEAVVTSVTYSREAFAGDAAGPRLYVVQARVRTRDGRELAGRADGFYGDDAQQWQGTTRPAWYDADQPTRFTLVPPRRERGVSGGDAFVYAVVGLIAAVAAAVVLL